MMLVPAIRVAVAALFFTLALFAANSPAAQAAPESGHAFTLKVHAKGSARAAFREAVARLGNGRLRNVKIRSALADRSDRFVEGFFSAHDGGTAVSGVLLAGSGGVAGGVVDTPEALPHSFSSLMQQLEHMLPAGASGATASAPHALRRVSFGSGTIALPETWQVANSYQGCVEAVSTHDHGYIALGCPQQGVVPPGLPGTNPRVQLVVPFGNPGQVLSAIATSSPPAGLNLGPIRIAEMQPIDAGLPNGRAAYILFDYRISGMPFRGLAMISIAPVDTMSFTVYKSMFMLPADSFARLAPTLWRSWQSWSVNGDVLTGRLVSAATSMRETGSLITGAYWDRQHASESANAGFSQYLRDTATVEHIETGARAEGSLANAQAIVDRDPTKLRIVPSSELIPR